MSETLHRLLLDKPLMPVYSRFSNDSDVYLYTDPKVGHVCYSCRLHEGDNPKAVTLATAQEVLTHLEAHCAEGHKITRASMHLVKEELGIEV